MLDSGGKSRVKRTLRPLSGSAHPAITLARILAPWLWGMLKMGLFRGSLPTTSSYQKGESKVLGAKDYRFTFS